MRKLRKFSPLIIWVLFIGLVILEFVQYQNIQKLETNIGDTYLSNISSLQQHINRVETYLSDEIAFNASDLNNYYYEVNYLLTLKLPSVNATTRYIAAIQGGVLKMHDLIVKGAPKQEIDNERTRILKIIVPLKKGLEEMSNVGKVKAGNGCSENYKEYYKLSLPCSKKMESINDELVRQFKG